MKHLSPAEFTDLLDGSLPAERAAHVDACGECSQRHVALRDAFETAASVEALEPSPLFWDHLTARVSAGIDAEASGPAQPPWFFRVARTPAGGWGIAASIALLLMAASFWQAARTAGDRGVPPASPGVETAERTPVDASLEADEAWAVVRSAAADLGWEDTQAAGISARPGSADRVLQELTGAERAELARLLEEELKNNGA